MKKIKLFILTKSIGLYLNCLIYINAERATDLAYTLFSNPRKGKLKRGKLPKTLQNIRHETLQHDSDKFQTYIWHGDENVILLVHGWESNASRWKKLLHHLIPTGHTIVAIDAPAHGLSDGKEFNTPKYAEFIHVLVKKHQPKVLIGHSLGGMTISYYLHKYKSPNIAKVVLLGAPSDFKIISDNFISLLSLNNKTKKHFENYFLENFNIDANKFSGHQLAKNFSQKALIAHDTEDKVVLVEEGRKYANSWKNAIYIETSGLGHRLHDDNLYKKIIEFISNH